MDTINTNSIDTNSVDKKKKLFLPKLLIALSSLFSIVGVGLAILPNHYKSAKAFSYDDEVYAITLSADELNNYHFDNLNSFFLTHYDDVETTIFDDATYNDVSYPFQGFDLDDIDDYLWFYYEYNSYQISFNRNALTGDNYNNFTFIYDEAVVLTFESSVTFGFSSSLYEGIKQAIEQDIQANQPYEPNNFLLDAITLLVSPIVLIATGMGTGISSTISSLIYYNGAMSPFMAIILIFGGIALALALSRWVVNLIGSLGQRNR